MSNRFEGRRAVVTGAGSGIGAATVERFASEGADVLGLDVNEDGLAATCDSLPSASWRCVDIRSDDAIGAMADFGSVEVLVNAAGVLRRHELLDHPLVAWQETLDINLKAAFRLSREFARDHVARSAPGAIVNISSIEAFTAAAAHAAYTVSKTGVMMLTRAFALELGEHGIRVNAIAPGVTETRMNLDLRSDPERAARARALKPLGRFATPAEQAAAIAFLASEDASFITGVVLPVDGGWLTA